jgi:hypothetical protein
MDEAGIFVNIRNYWTFINAFKIGNFSSLIKIFRSVDLFGWPVAYRCKRRDGRERKGVKSNPRGVSSWSLGPGGLFFFGGLFAARRPVRGRARRQRGVPGRGRPRPLSPRPPRGRQRLGDVARPYEKRERVRVVSRHGRRFSPSRARVCVAW